MTQAHLADGTILDFPDNTDEAVIDKVVKSHMADSSSAAAATKNDISIPESIARGGVYGAIQQPRDVIAAGYASLFDDVSFQDALKNAKEMSLEGQQGEAQKQNPMSFAGGQIGGNIATTLLPSAGAANLVGKLAPIASKAPVVGNALSSIARGVGASKGIVGVPLRGAIEGAVSSGMTEGDPTGGAEGGAIGAGLSGIVGKIAKPIADASIEPVHKAYVETLKKLGIDNLTAGQMTGNKTLQMVDSVLGNMPFTAGSERQRAISQGKKFTEAALQKAGITGEDLITPEVRSVAEKQFSNKYEVLFGNKTVNIDTPVLNKIAEITTDRIDKLPTNLKPIVESYMKDIVQSGGSITGKAYQNARSQLSSQAKSLAVNDPFTANVLRDLRNTLDDAAERSLPIADKGKIKELNRQYSNYKTIQKTASSTSQDSLEGMLSPKALLRNVETANKTKGQKGYGDLYNISRAGSAVLSDSIPNSGTAQRQLIQNLVTGAGFGLGAGGATYGATNDPATAAAAMAAGVASPKLVQALINSGAGKKYLTEGIPLAKELATKKAKDLAAIIGASISTQGSKK